MVIQVQSGGTMTDLVESSDEEAIWVKVAFNGTVGFEM